MKSKLSELMMNWEHEAASARKMAAETLTMFNKYLATDLQELWHNSQSIFLTDKDEAEVVMKRARLTAGTIRVVGSIALEEYSQEITMVSLRDHHYLGALLRRKGDEREVVVEDEDEIENSDKGEDNE